jgi:hypothetical protein
MKKLKGKFEDMVIELPPHFNQDFLTDNRLEHVDVIFHQAGYQHGPHIQAAVKKEQVELFQADGDIDYFPLHLKGKDPEKEADEYQKEQKEL